MSLATTSHDLKSLIRSWHPIVVIETVEEERVRNLLTLVAADLRIPLYEWSITEGLRRHRSAAVFEGTESVTGLLRELRAIPNEGIFLLKDFSQHLSGGAVTRTFREIAQTFAKSSSVLILTGDPVELPPEVEHKAVWLELRLPDRDELREIVQSTLVSLRGREKFELALEKGDGESLLRALAGLTADQARHVLGWVIFQDARLDGSDVRRILDRKREILEDGGLLDYYPLDDNRFEVGGFARLKEWLARSQAGFSPRAAEYNLAPPRGILIVGVQGCGKSLAAKFVAREWKLPLLKLDGGKLYDKYVGETERNLRRAIDVAESMAPAVLWIDEIEKVFGHGAHSEYDAGLSRRIFGSFLTWLQEKKKNVFVVGAANDLLSVPPELLRKGRFDEIFFVDLPVAEERESIFEIHLRLRNQKPEEFDLGALSTAAEGFSGAEIEQAVIGSLYRAIHDKKEPSTELLLEEIAATVPLSVSRAEDVERIRQTAAGRFVNVR